MGREFVAVHMGGREEHPLKLNRLAGKRPAAMALSIVATAAFAAASTGGATAAPSGGATGLYVVQTVSKPVALDASTKPAAGQKVNARSAKAQQLLQRLRTEHEAALRASRVSTSKVVADFGVTFNGFAARLTEAEANRLKGAKGVAKVWKSETLYADTVTTPGFLGMTGAKGVWNKQFQGDAHAGEGMIVGVIDSGIWAENPSFAALSEPRPDQAAINAKWHGTCDSGTEEPITCNNKLIGARYYNESATVLDQEFLSPRDFNGHGSHTASTSAGNFGVAANVNGFDFGAASGMAPAARVAAYKVLWQTSDGRASGGTVDILHAIEDAVADGVDVINYSISGSRLYAVDPVELAFLNAAAAGVFVSTSAGNEGDTFGSGSVAHNAPWTTTVAASTHPRGNAKTVTLGNGTSITGPGAIPPAVPSSPLILSTAAGLPGANATAVRLCFLDVLDPALVTGKIVVCDRGSNARIEKSKAVKLAGGVGMILANTSDAQSLNADFHYVPTVHLTATQAGPVKTYAATAGATAAMSTTDTSPVTAPSMAGFSSYGPAQSGAGDLLKPDITAPGVDVIAAVSPAGNDGKTFDAFSGTSMSAPHIAGIAALLMQKHPDWTPMMIKSAMMTTASTKDTAGHTIQWSQGDATPLNFGSGHVVPGSAFDPGLVYNSGELEWYQFTCGVGQLQLLGGGTEFCNQIGSIDPSDLNYPSISIGDLPGAQTITRTVTNVSKKPGLYLPVVKAPAGFKVKVSKPLLVVMPGNSATFKVTITRTTAAIGEWAFGSLTLKEFGTGHHVVTSPIAVRPVALSAPAVVNGTGASGSSAQSVKPGYTGTLNANVAGLAASSVTDLTFTATDTSFNPSSPAEGPGVKKVTVTVPAGSTLARFATFDSDVPMGTDVDLFAFESGTANQVGQSAGGTTEESITLSAAGTYDIYVVLFAAADPLPTVKHHAFVVPGSAAGNLTATPASQSVTIGTPASVNLAWSGLTAGVRYLGVVSYTDGTNTLGQTIVSITG